MSQFGGRVDAFMGEFFRLYPVAATATGMHDYDGDWPDLSAAGRAARPCRVIVRCRQRHYFRRWTRIMTA